MHVAAALLGEFVEVVDEVELDARGIDAHFLENRRDESAFLGQERGEQMRRLQLRMAGFFGGLLRGLQGLLRFDGEAIEIHNPVLS